MPTRSPTLTQFIRERESAASDATGEFTFLMHGIALAAKLIGREVNKAGLVDILGLTGRRNVQGEEVQKLDEFAQTVMVRSLERTGAVCVMGSEEAEDPIAVQPHAACGKYQSRYLRRHLPPTHARRAGNRGGSKRLRRHPRGSVDPGADRRVRRRAPAPG
jgi:hypothetical protein